MANRNYQSQRIYNLHVMPVQIDACVSIGSSGAPTIASGAGLGIKAITRMAAGQYRIQLEDNYAKLLSFQATMQSDLSGSSVNMGSLSTGTVYQITALGNSTQAQWVAAGVPSGITAAVGVVFKAAAVGAGTGTVQALVTSGINSVEIMGNSPNMLNNQPYNSRNGGYIDFQTMGPTDASTTTPIAKDPADGSKMYIKILLSNSSVS